jgi:HD superfamily phosphohydrolase YqeK
MATTMKEFRANLNEQVSKEIMAIRMPHTKATSESAMLIADRMSGINKYDLLAACILHDIAKELSYEMMVKIIINAKGHPLLDEVIGDIDMSEYESQKWLHGIVGAIIAHDVYKITSKPVLKAIRYHKVGSLDDDIFTKILITADVANNLRKARHMITAYTALKMSKYEIENIYKNIVKYDTGLAITNDDIAIPRMIRGLAFQLMKLNKWKNISRLGAYYLDDIDVVWLPYYLGDGKWKVLTADGLYITPKGFDNAKIVIENINLGPDQKFHLPHTIFTLSEGDWGSYMITRIDKDYNFEHSVISFDDANKSGARISRTFIFTNPTRLYAIDMGEYQ